MGTRGLFGFKFRGVYYLIYNHFDSYPSGLGKDLLNEIKRAITEGRLDEWKDKVVALQGVARNDEPTEAAIQKLRPYIDVTVSTQSTRDWYCLLRGTQGSFEKVLDAGYFINEHTPDQLTRDLFIEYAYVLDFDDNVLNCYASGAGLFQTIGLSEIDDTTVIKQPGDE
jgi:hypothetical protein